MFEITDEFHVVAPPTKAWDALLDIERVAACMPGVTLLEVEDRGARGRLKVRIGPVTAHYEGRARITATDDSARRATIEAQGRETKGQGNASVAIEIVVSGSPDGTATVAVSSQIRITGRVAQFGRGVIQDVSRSLMAEFASRLETELVADQLEGAPDVPRHQPDEAVDLLSVAARPILDRIAPVVMVALVAALGGWWVGRRRPGPDRDRGL